MNDDKWAEKHANTYAKADWINRPSIFAEWLVDSIPAEGKLLDLGAGQGQDSRFFAEKGYEVVSTDLEQSALDLSGQKLSEDIAGKVVLQKVDMRQPLPFDDASFDVVYAHMSVHYFDEATTRQLFTEIRRVLKPGGVFACLVNAKTDPEYGQGTELGEDYYRVDDANKRFFSVDTLGAFANDFEIKVLDDQGETYKDAAKGVHNLIRFVGQKA